MPNHSLIRVLALASVFAAAGAWLHAEQSVFYTPMLDAYQAGKVDAARDLARKYLDRATEVLSGAQMDIDRDSAVVKAADLVASLMAQESAQAAGGQYGPNAELLSRAGELLGRAREVHARIAQTTDPAGVFRTETLTNSSIYWIQAATPRLPAAQVRAFYDSFGSLLGARGINNLQDAVQSPRRLRPAAVAPPGQAAAGFPQEDAAIRAAVAEYLNATVAGNAGRLARATGGAPAQAQRMLDLNAAGFEKENVRRVVSWQLPESGNWGAAIGGTGPEYNLTVRNIRLTVIDRNGNQISREIDKVFQLRRSAPGKWTVVLPQGGVQQ